MTRNSFEKVPIPMFFMIRSYAGDKDYRSLMNCQSSFRAIKHETVRLHLRIKEKRLNSKQIQFLEKTVKSVKNKNQQIMMTINPIPPKQLLFYSQFFDSIHHLTLSDVSFMNSTTTFDPNLFNNIYRVDLTSWSGVDRIEGGFENVVILHIIRFEHLKYIQNLNKHKTFKEFHLYCSDLSELNMNMEGIDDIIVYSRRIDHCRSSFGGQKRLTFVTQTILPEILEGIMFVTSSLDSLHLECSFPEGYRDLSIFKDIPTLEITDNHRSGEKICIFPPNFPCIDLKLSSFDLSSWNHPKTIANNILILRLFEISGITHFPVMPSLRELRINRCDDLLTVPTLERLEKLRLVSVHQLQSIASLQPCLKFVTISQTMNLIQLSFHDVNHENIVESLFLHQCPQVTDIRSFSNTPDLQISDCDGITTLAGLNGSSLENDRRTIQLKRLKNLIDFSGLFNIYKLELVNIPHLTNGEGIHNIHHLKLHCSNLKDLSGISNIKSSITLYGCSELTSLINIEGIPKVLFVCDTAKMRFNGLKNHEEVKIACNNSQRKRLLGLQSSQREMNIQRLIIECGDQQDVFTL
eukprot:gene5296-5679_t